MTLRLDLRAIDEALRGVERSWAGIGLDLELLGVSKPPLTSAVRERMLSAYAYLDQLLELGIEPMSDIGMEHMLELNHRVHFGVDEALRSQYALAIDATIDKFNANIESIATWYWTHVRRGDHPLKLAAETYVSILGQPQLFVEGNHRTGALIASWINLRADYPPFVLSTENALAYFAPAAAIKRFADRSTWRGRHSLPKYRKSFRTFWETHLDRKYVLIEARSPTNTSSQTKSRSGAALS
jgi:hypothetical protein